MSELFLGIAGTLAVVCSALAWRYRNELHAARSKYSGIIDVEDEIHKIKARVAELNETHDQCEAENARKRDQLCRDYDAALSRYKGLKKEVQLLEEDLEDTSFGIYKPHFSFQSSEEYKAALEQSRDECRQMVRDGKATHCPVTWTVGDSKRDGERMVKKNMKLMLRAFNGECEAALANVSWNNISKMEERIRKACEAINDLGAVMQVTITPAYMNLKLKELRLSHEQEEKKYQEKEEQRRIREQIREEERDQKEIEKALDEAAKDEERFQAALEKARQEVLQATGSQLQKLTDQINKFEAKLDEARQRKERAISRAQLTKSGFVYVISNIGSFGDGVFKIGMTRRLEPMDRIAELGDASVPFPFDLHAMLYSDNAPELESALHQLFADRQLNLVNRRREFFQSVKLEEVEDFVRARGLSAQFIKHPEARQYRETVATRQQRLSLAAAKAEPPKFPLHVFDAPSEIQSEMNAVTSDPLGD